MVEWWRNRIHPDDRARILQSMPPPVIDGGQQWTLEYRLRRTDGTYAHVYDRGFVIFDAEGEPVRMVGSLMDISQLKLTEERLRESEERFHAFMNNSPATAFMKDEAVRWDGLVKLSKLPKVR